MFTKKIADYITAARLIQPGQRVLVALSGGADSVALLCVLKQLGYGVEAVHCNFHLRGDESDRDEAFVCRLCAAGDVPLQVVHFDTSAYAVRRKISIEMAARELRYEAFESLRREHGADVIAVAHHRDDSVETLLLNLIRGTGVNGLKGIRPRNGRVVRPLLAVSRRDILDYLNALGQDYVTDSTNLHDDYVRNKIRLNLLPLMEQINPSVRDGLMATASRLADAAAIYNKVIGEEKARVSTLMPDGGLRIDRTAWQASDIPGSLLYELLSPYGFNVAQAEDVASSALRPSGRRFRSATHELVSDRDCWLLYPLSVEADCSFMIREPDGGQALAAGGGHLTWTVFRPDDGWEVPRDKRTACVDADKLAFPLLVRRVATGDRFVPFGMKGHKLLSDYMTDRKFSLRQKECQMVVCSADGRIVWLVGERVDERFRVTDATRRVLRMDYMT